MNLLKIFFVSMAETILSDRTCKNCMWWNQDAARGDLYGKCTNGIVKVYTNDQPITPPKHFGCSQWRKL